MPTKKTKKKASPKFHYLRSNMIIYSVVVVAVAAILISVVPATASKISSQSRLQKINDIYTSLRLGDDYTLVNSDVFGDKRPYDWDSSRTYSSQKTYVRAETVSKTTDELRKKIESAGFKYLETPYPNAAYTMLIYKSDDGHYIRLNVSSKPHDDMIQNKILMGKNISESDYASDTDAGPSNVTIKVNLDDNNE